MGGQLLISPLCRVAPYTGFAVFVVLRKKQNAVQGREIGTETAHFSQRRERNQNEEIQIKPDNISPFILIPAETPDNWAIWQPYTWHENLRHSTGKNIVLE